MNAKKLLSLVFSAAFAVAALAGCGGSDFSREAARAANKAQDTVTFETDANLTKALQKALEDNAGDIRQAVADALGDELGSGDAVDLYTVSAEDAKTAAEAVAASIAKSVAGKQSKGAITMVKADDGAFYAVTITTRTGSSGGSGSGSGSGGDGNTGTTVNCTITIVGSEHGSVTTDKTTVAQGTSVTFNVEPDNTYDLSKLTVNSEDKTSQVENNQITLIIDSDTEIEATFVKSKIRSWKPTGVINTDTYHVGDELDASGLRIDVTYKNDDTEQIMIGGHESEYIKGWPIKMYPTVRAITIMYNSQERQFTLTPDNYTFIPTESEYGESKYLTEEDFAAIKETFEKEVTEDGKAVGTDSEIQRILNTSSNIYADLWSKGYQFRLIKTGYAENAAGIQSFIQNETNGMMVYGNNQAIYMTIKDTADAKIACSIYAVFTPSYN